MLAGVFVRHSASYPKTWLDTLNLFVEGIGDFRFMENLGIVGK